MTITFINVSSVKDAIVQSFLFNDGKPFDKNTLQREVERILNTRLINSKDYSLTEFHVGLEELVRDGSITKRLKASAWEYSC
jgi:hypothetical protein